MQTVADPPGRPRVALFAPHPLLTVTIELEGDERQQIHFHAGGQGPWAARMVAHMGATPVLCGFLGGESGELLQGLLEKSIAPGELRLVPTGASSGCYVTDRREGERKLLAMTLSATTLAARARRAVLPDLRGSDRLRVADRHQPDARQLAAA